MQYICKKNLNFVIIHNDSPLFWKIWIYATKIPKNLRFSLGFSQILLFSHFL